MTCEKTFCPWYGRCAYSPGGFLFIDDLPCPKDDEPQPKNTNIQQSLQNNMPKKNLDIDMEDIDKEIEEVKKTIGTVSGIDVTVNGKDLSYLKKFTDTFLNEYRRMRAALPFEKQDGIVFGANRYGVRINYGVEFGFSMGFFPNPNPGPDPDYLIGTKLMLANPAMQVQGNGCIRMNLQNPPGAVEVYFFSNSKEILTPELAVQKAKEFFIQDAKLIGIVL